jgi:hypothetical protein
MKAGTADGVVVKKYRKTEPIPDISKNRYRNRTELKKIPKKNEKPYRLQIPTPTHH